MCDTQQLNTQLRMMQERERILDDKLIYESNVFIQDSLLLLHHLQLSVQLW